MTRLVVATRSPGKAREIRHIFHGHPFALVLPDDLGLVPLPEEEALETGTTFGENAVLKARYFARRAGLPAVADDSGLEVDALGGAPGVHSARWSSVRGPAADEANNRLLLERLAGVPSEQRTARYRCVAAFVAGPADEPQWAEGVAEGRILEVPRGTGGFGYDPLFFSTELGQTFAEVRAEDKHSVSHRGRAFRALIRQLVGGTQGGSRV